MVAAVRREPNVTVLTGRTAVDLLSLSHHSRNPLDIYAAPTCVGAYVFNHETRQVEPILAKAITEVFTDGSVTSMFDDDSLESEASSH